MYYILYTRHDGKNEIHGTAGKEPTLKGAISVMVDAIAKACRECGTFPSEKGAFFEKIQQGFGLNAAGQKCWADPQTGLYFELFLETRPGDAQA